MVRRHALIALGAMLAGTGCHAGLSGNTARTTPTLPRETVSVKRFIDQHNQNAMALRSLTSRPRIAVAYEGGGGGVTGFLDLERPRDFRLVLKASVGGKLADIGSNEQGFWFWVNDKKDKSIYTCKYKDVDSSQLAVTYQPDWIIEAMGLREIDPTEALTMAATRPTDRPGILILTQRRKDNHGDMLTKETVVDEQTGHIKEHRLYAGAKKDLLARATVTQYKAYVLKPTEDNPSGSTIQLPEKFRLEWVLEKFSLDVTMADVRVNPSYNPEQKTALFNEPKIPDVQRKDLALMGNPGTGNSKVYESMPPPRTGVRLGPVEPLPMGVDGALRTKGSSTPGRADFSSLPPLPETVVGAPIPRGTDPEAVQSSVVRSSWRPSSLIR